MSELTLDKIIPTEAQVEALYVLLKSRQYSISHVDMPSYEEHSEFVKNNPYRCWYLAYSNSAVVGSLYVQFDNSVGIDLDRAVESGLMSQLINQLRRTLEPLDAIASLRYKDFFINVPYADDGRKECLRKIGYIPSQVSFILADQ